MRPAAHGAAHLAVRLLPRCALHSITFDPLRRADHLHLLLRHCWQRICTWYVYGHPAPKHTLLHKLPPLPSLPMLQTSLLGMFALKDGDPEGWWEETFKSHHDSKPAGPEAISMDISFLGSKHLYGLPEHATDLSLKPTVGVLLSAWLCLAGQHACPWQLGMWPVQGTSSAALTAS